MFSWRPGDMQEMQVAGAPLEVKCHGPHPNSADTIVLLHEGLGCAELWRDFPERLSKATGLGVAFWSRAGYGRSAPCDLPRPLDYMRIEGEEILPQVLDQIGFRRGVLLGHSDGASIVAHYMGAHEDHRVNAMVLIAPHFFTEPEGLAEIARARDAFEASDLRHRLAKYHSDPDMAFCGWNNAWLDAGFRTWDITDTLAFPRVPILALQGADDPYGSRAQVDVIEELAYCPVEIVVLDDVRHTPHLEASEASLSHISTFLERLGRLERSGPDLSARS